MNAEWVGDVTKQADGRYKGCLNTVSIKADIDVLTCAENTNNGQLAFRVVFADIEIGAGWMRKCETSNTKYVSLSIAALESGSPNLYANLREAAGSEDKDLYVVIWIPVDQTKAPARDLHGAINFNAD